MKVSVVVPAFNAEKFLEECLQSVKAQTFNRFNPIQIVVVNDGSTDNTQTIAEQFTDRIMQRVVNRGIGYTRKDGTEFANGDYIAFLSADDAYHPYFLELMMRQADDKSILFSNYWRCNEYLQPQTVFICPRFKTQKQLRKLAIEWALKRNMFVNFSSIIIPKYVFNHVQFDETIRWGEDLVFLLECLKANIPFKHIELPLLYYRVHKEAGTKKRWQIEKDHPNFWMTPAHLLIELGVPEENVMKARKKAYQKRKLRSIIPPKVKATVRELWSKL